MLGRPPPQSSPVRAAAWAGSLALSLVLGLVASCDDATHDAAVVELYVDGTRAPDAARIDFPAAVVGKDTLAAQVELRNLGPGPLELDGAPLVRLEKDDRLAFTATQPAASRFEAGSSATFSVVFHPHAAGHDEGRVVIAVRGREPFVIEVTGDATTGETPTPALAATLDGAAVTAAFDFGAVAPNAQKDATLTLSNAGTGALTLSSTSTVVVSGDGFAAGPLTKLELASGESTDVAITFTPTACQAYRGTLTVSSPVGGGAPTVVELTGRGGTNPQGYDGVTEALAQPDGDVTLSDATSGSRRLAVGNLAFGSFTGRVGLYPWDGCSLATPRELTPTATGSAVQLFGAQVALDDSGRLLLATARDADTAWLFALAEDGSASVTASLKTLKAGKGNGRGAALSGDGSLALVGQPLADSGFNPHGVVLAYPKPTSGWSNFTDARFRLGPSNPTTVRQLGAWVETSADGSVVIAGGFESDTSGNLGAPRVYVWEQAGSGADATWGDPNGSGVPQPQVETVVLTAPGTTATIAAPALARDGGTAALAVDADGAIRVVVWVRSGASWDATGGARELPPTASIALADATARTRLALGPTGEFLVAADGGGAREILRPASGWDASASVGRRWNIAFFGAVALSPDAQALAGLDAAGRGWLLWR